jgi:hypothetical protein
MNKKIILFSLILFLFSCQVQLANDSAASQNRRTEFVVVEADRLNVSEVQNSNSIQIPSGNEINNPEIKPQTQIDSEKIISPKINCSVFKFFRPNPSRNGEED